MRCMRWEIERKLRLAQRPAAERSASLEKSEKRRRASPEQRQNERERERQMNRSYLSSSSSSSSDEEEEEKKQEREEVEIKYADTKDQLEKLRLSRFKLERLVHLPFFARIVNGCFVRINIGVHNGLPVYRVAQVVDVFETKAKLYDLENTRTNKELNLRHGTQEKIFSMDYVSNQEFTESEFQFWNKAMKDASKKPPTMKFVRNKLQEVQEALMYEFKEEDVQKTVAEKELNAQILESEERASQLDKTRTSSIQSILDINKRNRKLNVQTAKKAMKAEVKPKKEDDTGYDPFTRRRTRPVLCLRPSRQQQQQGSGRYF